jgi:hypothetical protein
MHKIMEKTAMRRAVMFPPCLLFVMFLFVPAAPAQTPAPTIADFKVQALYRAAKLTWNVRADLKESMGLKILRAASSAEGPYQEVEVVKLTPGKSAYDYVDKSMGAESMFYYKLVVSETGESFGPIAARPFFSPPATQWHSPERPRPLLALLDTGR